MTTTRDWRRNRDLWVGILKKQTGEGLTEWNQRIKEQTLTDERRLRAWLVKQGVTGYAQSLLVMERFGYPDFVLASAEQLIHQQYTDRKQLEPIYNAIVDAAAALGEVIIQARKTYVSLASPRRTFARVQAATKTRVDLSLRLEGRKPRGRLQRSRIHETMPVQISLTSPGAVDAEVLDWLRRAYEENS